MPEAILGIDTSCYTTSVALASNGRILCSGRKLLTVEAGKQGLRQSEAVFQHIKILPDLLETLFKNAGSFRLSAVCASEKPRDAEDSYMPVFQAGKSCARSIAVAFGIPIYYTSHQQGHIRAALVDTEMPNEPFVALHLSGGTTQTLFVERGLRITEIGGTNDLNAGQLVDRIGVCMGLSFPSGPELEMLALNGKTEALIPISRKEDACSFSGAENCAKRMLEQGKSKQDVAREIYSFLERSVFHLLVSACERTGVKQALLAGGVASSTLLRTLLTDRMQKRHKQIKLYWARPELSGDNACGVALIGEEKSKGC